MVLPFYLFVFNYYSKVLTAINGSVKHFTDKLEATKGPKVVKTFE
jgi:hypothetical protein